VRERNNEDFPPGQSSSDVGWNISSFLLLPLRNPRPIDPFLLLFAPLLPWNQMNIFISPERVTIRLLSPSFRSFPPSVPSIYLVPPFTQIQ